MSEKRFDFRCRAVGFQIIAYLVGRSADSVIPQEPVIFCPPVNLPFVFILGFDGIYPVLRVAADTYFAHMVDIMIAKYRQGIGKSC